MESASPVDAGIGRESTRDARSVAFTAPTGNFKRDTGRTPRTTRSSFGGPTVATDARRLYRRAGHPPATGDGHT
jgi:hypothetical protein